MKLNLTSTASFYPTSINLCFLRGYLLSTLKKSNMFPGLHRKRGHPLTLFNEVLHKDFEKRKKKSENNWKFESFPVMGSTETEKLRHARQVIHSKVIIKKIANVP